MVAVLVASQSFVFADGNAGHVIDLGSAPPVGYLDVLCVCSNTTVSSPAGFLIAGANQDVANMGMYLWRRIAAGGEGSTVTVTTNGNHNTFVGWSRWRNINAADDAAKTVQGSAGSASPSHSTATLAETNELAIAFAALHNIGAADQNTPIWSGSFTGLLAATQGSGADGVVGYVGYRTNAGTAAASPGVSWSGATASDRGMMTLTFTTVAGAAEVTLTPAAMTMTAMPVTATPGPVTVALTPAALTLAAVPLGLPGTVLEPGNPLTASGQAASTLAAAGSESTLVASGRP